MRKVDRGTKLLEKIRSRTGMSEDGMNWLIAVLDPQHDERLECNGYPDRQTGPSVIQVIKQSFDLAIPSVYTAGGTLTPTWGFHIYNDDYLCPDLYFNASGVAVENQNLKEDQTATPNGYLNVGSLNCIAFNQTVSMGNEITVLPPAIGAGKPFALLGPGAADTSLQSSFLKGKLRKIAEGFEVCNTTAELYRGGSVAVYEQPCSKNDHTAYYVNMTAVALPQEIISRYGAENIFIEEPQLIDKVVVKEEKIISLATEMHEEKEKTHDLPVDEYTPKRYYVNEKGIGGVINRVYLDKYLITVTRQGVSTMTIDVMKPRTLAEAMLLPGTAQWGAEEGCYCVSTMDDMNNPPTLTNTQATIYTVDETVWPVAFSNSNFSNSVYVPNFYADVTQNLVCGANNFKGPWNPKGAIFTGLTTQSTFKVNRTVVLERFISSQNGNLAVLAKMSPCEDYMALGFYSEIVKRMPVGCRFKDNGLGDWFMGIADGIADFVTGIAKPVIGAAEGWSSARRGGNPIPSSAPSSIQVFKDKPMTPKRVIKANGGRLKKNNAVQFGPRMQNGSFKSSGAQGIKRGKKIHQKLVQKKGAQDTK
jgi:hypothetical protein